MTPKFQFSRLAIASHQALRPTQAPPTPVEVDPAPGNAAMGALATALTATGARVAADSNPDPANGKVSTDSRAGEVAVGAFEARPDDHALRNRKLAVLVGSRIVAARELSGIQQFEFSKAIGHATPAQPSLWEQGRRLLPMADLPAVSRALGVSADYLLGLSDEPERDPAAARRALVMGHLRDQLETVTGHLADAALESAVEIEMAMRTTGLLRKAEAMALAVARFEAANAAVFDDLPAGALLRFAARELAAAVGPVATELDAVAKRRERAGRAAKAAMAAGVL